MTLTWAAAIDTPGESRPMPIKNHWCLASIHERKPSSARGRISASCMVMGTQKSMTAPMVVPMNAGAAIPTTVYGAPLIDRRAPTTPGSPPKRRCQ